MTNKEIIVRLVRNSLQMHPWEVRERVIEQELLIQIECVTNKETAETIRDICASVKNDYCFYQYLRMLDTVLEAILIGISIDDIIKVIDNCIKGETIYSLIEKNRETMMDHESLDDFAKSMECSRVRVEKNKSALREMYTFKRKDKDRIRIQTRQQGSTLKYKRYELRIYDRMIRRSRKIKYLEEENDDKAKTGTWNGIATSN